MSIELLPTCAFIGNFSSHFLRCCSMMDVDSGEEFAMTVSSAIVSRGPARVNPDLGS